MNPQIPIFNAYALSGAPPFLFVQSYDIEQSNEASLYNSIYSEHTFLHGSDVTYIPREVGTSEPIFGEYLAAMFEQGFPMRLFLEEMEAWGGGGDIFSKFGLQVTDECTLFCNKTTFAQAAPNEYPKQGDLFYIHKSQKLFELSHVEDEISPAFYLLGNRSGYKMQCKLFSYSHQAISQDPDSGIPTAIQALDSLLQDTNTNEQVTLETKEVRNNNQNIISSAISVLDNSELDPLA